MIWYYVKFQDGTYLGLNDNASNTKDTIFKTTKNKAKKYTTEKNAKYASNIACCEDYLHKEAYYAIIEK